MCPYKKDSHIGSVLERGSTVYLYLRDLSLVTLQSVNTVECGGIEHTGCTCGQ